MPMWSMLIEKPSTEEDVFLFQSRGPRQLWIHFIVGVVLCSGAYWMRLYCGQDSWVHMGAFILGYIPGWVALLFAFGWVFWFGTLVINQPDQVLHWTWKMFGIGWRKTFRFDELDHILVRTNMHESTTSTGDPPNYTYRVDYDWTCFLVTKSRGTNKDF